MVALGLGYEYSDYGAAQNRVNNGTDYYGNTASTTDQPMKRNTENALKGVHTVKAGVELKPDPALAVRFGYNFVSAAYDKNGMRDMTIPSYGVMYASTNDYTNWKATHRLTCGIGYKFSNISLDAAYQYSATKGDFHPFQPYANDMGAVEVANKRHQVLLTLGYTF
jgi:opacity protein-like surface antigen